MTDHFKGNNGSDKQSVRSFKEQILAELEEAHRRRRLSEDHVVTSPSELETSHIDPVVTVDKAEDSDGIDTFSKSEQATTDERFDNNIIALPEEWGQARKPVKGQLTLDLDETIPLHPLSDDMLMASDEEVERDQPVEVSVDSDLNPLEDKTEDLSITRVMAGFQKLFDPAPKEDSSDAVSAEFADDDVVLEDDELVIPPVRDLEETQVFDTKEFQTLEDTEDMPQDKRYDKRQRTNRVARKISLFLLSLLTVLILATGFFVYRYVDSGIKPLDPKSTTYIQVEIPSGSGNKLIGKILEEAGVIKSGQIFNYYVKFKNYTNFKSGFYNFQKSMSLDTIAEKLQEGGSDVPERPALGKILIPEGYTLEQIAKAVTSNANTADKKDKTPFSEADFMDLVTDEAFIDKMVAKFPGLLASLPASSEVRYRLEGYLFPATYSYYEETTLEDIVEQMLAAMDANLSPFYSTIANQGMTVNQVLTMASLVEKEGATDDDRRLIAGVFYNRWNQGMPLQSNIAILYAMGKLGQATTLLEDATIDTGIDSPYNIYVNPGLMPGPVDSPSLSAIKATINPEQSNYLYFVADVTTGAVYYAENYDDHSANVDKYINSRLGQ